MPEFVMRVITPKGEYDPDKYTGDLKTALRDTGKILKGSVKKIKVVDDTVHFTVEPTSVAEKVIESIRSRLGVEVNLASPPLDAFAEKYGLTTTRAKG